MDSEYSAPSKQLKFGIAALEVGPMPSAITGVVTKLSEVKSYTNQRGPGQVFSFVWVDESAEIRVSVFGKDLMEFWKVCQSTAVRISGGTVKRADPQWNITDNPLEMTVSVDSCGSICSSNDVPPVRDLEFNFIELNEIPSIGTERFVDVRGAIHARQPAEEVLTQANKKIKVAKVSLVDRTGYSVSCAFWGSSSAQVDAWSIGDTLCIRKARVKEYAGAIVLSCTASDVLCNSEDQETRNLSEWYSTAKSGSTQFRAVPTQLHTGGSSSAIESRPNNRMVILQPPELYDFYLRSSNEVIMDFGSGRKITFRRVPCGDDARSQVVTNFDESDCQPLNSTPK